MKNDDPNKMKAFKYETPESDRAKKIIWLARTDHMIAVTQVISKGGENNLHSHEHMDGFWFVLSGRARFYSDFATVFAEVGKYEGVLTPRGVKYWFESVGDEPLELLQVESSDVSMTGMPRDRTDHEPQKNATRSSAHSEAKVVG